VAEQRPRAGVPDTTLLEFACGENKKFASKRK
jgi:hypothetical protein